jgi:hypothetical protein
VKAKTYKLEPKALRTIVEWATTGINSMTGKAYGSEADRALIFGFARELGMLHPMEFYRPIQTAGRLVPQIDATARLASEAAPSEVRRKERVSRGNKTETQAVP